MKSKKIYQIIICIGILFSWNSSNAEPIKSQLGVFVTSINNFNMLNNTYDISLWAWMVYNDPSGIYHPEKSTVITNSVGGISVGFDASRKTKSGLTWAYAEFKATMNQFWNITNFPFDRQVLTVVLEDSNYDSSSLQYTPDTESKSHIDPNIKLNGWKIVNTELKVEEITYKTTFGDPDLKEFSTYSRIVLYITIERYGLGIFVSLFTTIYIAFLIAVIVLYIPIDNFTPRLSMSASAIFVAVGGKYALESKLPLTPDITLPSRINLATFIFIGLTLLAVTVCDHLLSKERNNLAKIINNACRIIFPLSYVVLNVFWIYTAIAN